MTAAAAASTPITTTTSRSTMTTTTAATAASTTACVMTTHHCRHHRHEEFITDHDQALSLSSSSSSPSSCPASPLPVSPSSVTDIFPMTSRFGAVPSNLEAKSLTSVDDMDDEGVASSANAMTPTTTSSSSSSSSSDRGGSDSSDSSDTDDDDTSTEYTECHCLYLLQPQPPSDAFNGQHGSRHNHRHQDRILFEDGMEYVEMVLYYALRGDVVAPSTSTKSFLTQSKILSLTQTTTRSIPTWDNMNKMSSNTALLRSCLKSKPKYQNQNNVLGDGSGNDAVVVGGKDRVRHRHRQSRRFSFSGVSKLVEQSIVDYTARCRDDHKVGPNADSYTSRSAMTPIRRRNHLIDDNDLTFFNADSSSCSSSSNEKVKFYPCVDVIEIPSVRNYPHGLKGELWFSRHELHQLVSQMKAQRAQQHKRRRDIVKTLAAAAAEVARYKQDQRLIAQQLQWLQEDYDDDGYGDTDSDDIEDDDEADDEDDGMIEFA